MPLVDNQYENPSKSKMGQQDEEGKQHLLLDACLCMKLSLFPCTEFLFVDF